MRDRGSMTVVSVMMGVAVGAGALGALVPWLDDLQDRQRARHAADAAALAGVMGGRQGSEGLAAANGAVVEAWSRVGAVVTVTVRVDDSRATARATNGP